MEEIKNSWCVYGWFLGLWGFGEIVRDEQGYVDIRYSERQMYPTECWKPEWVKRFPTLIEAVEYYIEKRKGVDIRDRELTPREVRDFARRSFPSYYKKILPMIIST